MKSMGNATDRTITGPVMIRDLKIFRTTGPNGPENCYWYFSAQTINQLRKHILVKCKFDID